MKKIKKFIEAFCKIEADLENSKTETYFLEKKEDLVKYNQLLSEYSSFFIDELKGFQGYLPINELEEDEDVLEMIRSEEYNDVNPRHLFKISKYNDKKYGDVWILYLSNPKPSLDFKTLTNAFFVVQKNSEFKIANTLLYSNYSSDGKKYKWEETGGIRELNFKYLEDKLVEIERYIEPLDYYDSLNNYHGEF